MKIKHSKYKNTGILFELLVRQITADTLKGSNSPAIDILKEYFVKTSLGKEYKLYESVLKSKVLTEGRATLVIDTLLEASTKFNRKSLKKQKYNLINEIKKHYDLEIKEDSKTTVIQEFSKYDKDVRTLTYKVLLEKFNEKYDQLTNDQKQVLKEYINSVDSTPDLRNFYNVKINELKTILKKENKNIKDKATQIKISEVAKYLTELKKTDKVGDNNLVDLLRFYQLVNEIQVANGIQV